MTSLSNINSYLANDASIEARTKRTLQKCFNELSYTVDLPVAVEDGGTGADFSATGGPSQVVMQEDPGDPFTIRELVFGDINNTTLDPGIFDALSENDLVNIGGGPTLIETDIIATTLTDLRLSLNDFYKADNTQPADGGQIVNLTFRNAVTNVTWVYGTSTSGLTFPTTATAGSKFSFVWSAANNEWVRFV